MSLIQGVSSIYTNVTFETDENVLFIEVPLQRSMYTCTYINVNGVYKYICI